MEATITPEQTVGIEVEERIMLKEPVGTRFFTQDPTEAQRILDHFALSSGIIRERCVHLGIYFGGQAQCGEVRVRGPREKIEGLLNELRPTNMIIG